ncbi:lipoprotein NlpD [Alphaproteobacteria bacterium]
MQRNRKCFSNILSTIFMVVLQTSVLASCSTSVPPQVEHKGSLYYKHGDTMKIVKAHPNETLNDIAAKNDVPVEVLGSMNGVSYPYKTGQGRDVLVPAKQDQSAKETREAERYDAGSGDGEQYANSKLSPDANQKPYSQMYVEAIESEQMPPLQGNKLHNVQSEIVKKKERGGEFLNQNTDAVTTLDEKIEEKLKNKKLAEVQGRQDFVDATEDAPIAANFKYKTPLNSPQFIWPVQGNVIKHFNEGREGFNEGISISASLNTMVHAAADGKVLYSNNNTDKFGNLLIIQHESGYITAYAHNNQLLAKKGQQVKKGEEIAKVGKTGDVDSTQLYFSISKNKRIIDPESNVLG